jgi:arylsulfatase A-like enzyme
MELTTFAALLARWSRVRRAAALTLAAAAVLLIAARPVAQERTQTSRGTGRPNIVLIVSDDLGYSDIGAYGAKDIRTPHLDRLAKQGVRFTAAYSNGPVCTPTRAALMTGRYQQRVGLEQVLSLAADDLKRGLPANGHTLPALLKANGYATALYGKWHLGFSPEFQPNAHGFEDFFGFLSGAINYYTHRRRDGKPDLVENGSPVESEDYLTDAITRRGVDFIERNASKPFFLELAYNAPHWPFLPPDLPATIRRTELPSLLQLPDDANPPTRRDYARMVERLDSGIGEILTTLEKRQLASNTLVIFTNDNGGEWLSSNAPFFNRKSTLWEGGIRVPLILRWPGRVPAGRVSAQVAITMDLTATILSATKILPSPQYALDGIDLMPHIDASGVPSERQLFWRRLPFPNGQLAVRDGRWKLLVDGPNAFLFDVDADSGERRDLSTIHPNLVRKMRKLYEAWNADVSPSPPPR